MASKIFPGFGPLKENDHQWFSSPIFCNKFRWSGVLCRLVLLRLYLFYFFFCSVTLLLRSIRGFFSWCCFLDDDDLFPISVEHEWIRNVAKYGFCSNLMVLFEASPWSMWGSSLSAQIMKQSGSIFIPIIHKFYCKRNNSAVSEVQNSVSHLF